MILVTGATGNVGRSLVNRLLAAGEKVRALTRDPSRAALPDAVEVVAGDYDRPETITAALAGIDKAYLMVGGDVSGFPAAAAAAGVRHIVLLSSCDAYAHERENLIAKMHEDAEQAVRASGLAWTFLRPDGFASNTLRWAPAIRATGVVRTAFPEQGMPVIDPQDIAAVAVLALTQPGHEGKIYPLTGPESLTVPEQLAAIAAAIGRELRHVALTEDEALAELRRQLPAAIADGVFAVQQDRGSTRVPPLPTVAEVTGRPPRTFAEWAHAHAAAFR